MSSKNIPLTKEQIENIIKDYPTPFHLYDEQAIRNNAKRFLKAFSWNKGFKEYFAVKACPNPYIMKILKEEGFGTDCSSLTELLLSEKVNVKGEDIMFSSNETPAEEYVKAKELGAIINIDDITHIPFLKKATGIPKVISFRYNPGPLRTGNSIIGNPVESKYGFTKEQIFEGFAQVRDMGAERFGVHSFVISNELNRASYVETAKMLFELAVELKTKIGIRLEFINLSGGIGIPYRPEQEAVDLEKLGTEIKELYGKVVVPNGLDPLKIFTECGRMITGPYGYLITKAIHKKEIYKNYIGLDACMTNLMRPALYGAYHHITVLGKEKAAHDHKYDVVGSLCENNDKFAIDRMLPKINVNDIVIIHDTGAHGYAMGFNYNGKLRSSELLLRQDKSIQLIRRAETIEDYFATLNFEGL